MLILYRHRGHYNDFLKSEYHNTDIDKILPNMLDKNAIYRSTDHFFTLFKGNELIGFIPMNKNRSVTINIEKQMLCVPIIINEPYCTEVKIRRLKSQLLGLPSVDPAIDEDNLELEMNEYSEVRSPYKCKMEKEGVTTGVYETLPILISYSNEKIINYRPDSNVTELLTRINASSAVERVLYNLVLLIGLNEAFNIINGTLVESERILANPIRIQSKYLNKIEIAGYKMFY